MDNKIKTIVLTLGLTEKTRKQEVLFPRYFTIFWIKTNTDFSLTKIGQFFNQEHTTVLNAIKCHKWLVETNNPRYKDFTETVDALLNNRDIVYKTTLIEDIIKAETLMELHGIQYKIKADYYNKDLNKTQIQ